MNRVAAVLLAFLLLGFAVAGLIGQFLRAAGTEVRRLGGEVERYDVQGLVALFGARAAHEDDPERAVLAALAMQQGMAGAHWPPETGSLKIRIGLHTGEIIAKPLPRRPDGAGGATLGSAALVAEAIQASANPGDIAASESSQRDASAPGGD